MLKKFKDLLEKEYTLVFPSMEEAIYYRDKIASFNAPFVIENNKIISSSELKSRIFKSDKRPITLYAIKYFIRDFIQKYNFKTLKSKNENLKESYLNNLLFLASDVLKMKDYDPSSYNQLSKEQIDDLNLIKEKYEEFLIKSDFYDSSYLKANKIEGKFIFIFFTKEYNYLKYILKDQLSLFDYKIERVANLKEFKNSNIEIDFALKDIKRKLNLGVRASEISIILADPLYYEFLLEKANDYNIEISNNESKKLSSFLFYRYLMKLRILYKSNFSFSSLKSIFSDTSFDSNKEDLHLLITELAESHIDNLYPNDFRVKKEHHEFLNSYMESVKKINKSKNTYSLTNYIKEHIKLFFKQDVYEGSNMQMMAYNFINRQFSRLSYSLQMIDNNLDECFDFFLKCIKEVPYTHFETTKIQVYSYPINLLISNTYTLGLSSVNAKREFLRNNLDLKFDAYDKILSDYCLEYALSNKDAYLSYSLTSYDNSHIAPALCKKAKLIQDYTNQEADLYREYLFLKNNKDGYKYTYDKKRILDENNDANSFIKVDDNLSGFNFLSKAFHKKSIGVTLIDAYNEDSIALILKALNINEISLNNNEIDYMRMGNYVHAFLEDYLKQIKKNLKIEQRENYYLIKLEELKQHLMNGYKEYKKPLKYVVYSRVKSLENALIRFIKEVKINDFHESEKEISFKYKDYEIKGRIDLLESNLDDTYKIYDFKTSKNPPKINKDCKKNKVWQMILYKIALNALNMDIESVNYISLIKSSDDNSNLITSYDKDFLNEDYNENIFNIIDNLILDIENSKLSDYKSDTYSFIRRKGYNEF